MRTFVSTALLPSFFLFVILGGVAFPSFAKAAETVTFQTLDASQCGSAGCSTGETCVRTSSSVGYVPTCMSTVAATSVNYAYATDCTTACGHTCTSNPNSYAGTYYCAPAALAGAPDGSSCSLPSQCQSGICSYKFCQLDPRFPDLTIPPGVQISKAQSNCGNSGGTWDGINNTCRPVATVTPPPGGAGGSGTGTVVPSNGGTGTVSPGVTLINPLKSGTSLTSFLNNILDFVINIGSIIVILMLVFVGFKFVVAQGNDSKITEARTMLLWTIIGALVLLGAKAISAGILATVQSLGG